MYIIQILQLTFYHTCLITYLSNYPSLCPFTSPSYLFFMHFEENCRHQYTGISPLNMSACISLTRVQFEVKFAYSEMRKSEVHHSLSFNRCVHQCNTTPINKQDIAIAQMFPPAPLQATPRPYSPLPEAAITLTFSTTDQLFRCLDFHINGTIPFVSCVRWLSPSIAFLRLIHVVAYINHLFRFIAEQYPEYGYTTVFQLL